MLDNRLIAQGVASATTTYNYFPVGTLQNYTYSTNSVQTAYTYDTLNRLKTMGSTKGSTSLSNFTYVPYPAGNVNTVAELSGRGVTYVYDKDYHLQSETIASDPGGNNGAESYTYDAVGNRKTLASTIPSLPGSNSYTYDANDRLTTDTYDNDGNTTSSGGTANTYDFEDRMLTHGAVIMGYDGDGNRVSETAGGVTTQFLVDTLNPTGYSQVLDELVSGAVTKTYTYGLQRISENQLSGSTWTPSFYGYDGHGNVRFLTSVAGTVGNTYQFDAFGMPIASAGTTANSYLYSGERFDPNIGFYHLRARYYNQGTGRFLTMDPELGKIFDPGTLHKYVYTKNNPVNRVDPSGRADIIEVAFLYSRPGFSVLGRASLKFDPAKLEDTLIDLGLQSTDINTLALNASFAQGIGVCSAATFLVTSEVLGGLTNGGTGVSNVLLGCFGNALTGFLDNPLGNPLK